MDHFKHHSILKVYFSFNPIYFFEWGLEYTVVGPITVTKNLFFTLVSNESIIWPILLKKPHNLKKGL